MRIIRKYVRSSKRMNGRRVFASSGHRPALYVEDAPNFTELLVTNGTDWFYYEYPSEEFIGVELDGSRDIEDIARDIRLALRSGECEYRSVDDVIRDAEDGYGFKIVPEYHGMTISDIDHSVNYSDGMPNGYDVVEWAEV